MRCPSKLRLKVVGVSLNNICWPCGATSRVSARHIQITSPNARAALRPPTRWLQCTVRYRERHAHKATVAQVPPHIAHHPVRLRGGEQPLVNVRNKVSPYPPR